MTNRNRDQHDTLAEAQAANSRGLGLRGVLQIVIGIGALALVIVKSDARGLIEAIKATRISYLPIAFAASLLVTWVMAYRWQIILGVRGHKIKTARLFVYYLIGIFFSNFVPGGNVSGDVARLVYANREVRDKAFVLSTLVYERFVGLFTVLVILVAATMASRDHLSESKLIYIGESALALACLALAMLMSDYVSSRLARLALYVGARFRAERVSAAAARVFEATSELRRYKKMIVVTALLSVLIRTIWSFGCFAVALAMGLPIGITVVFAFISLVDLIRMLPLSIGGIGLREWALVALFANVGIRREQALMFSFLAFAPVVFNALVGGLIYISRAGLLRSNEPIAERAANGVKA